MKYCVLKNTTIIIDGSENPEEIMLQNVASAGFLENEVEILTEEEYKVRVELEPIPPQPPTKEELLEQEIASLRAMLETLIGGGE